MGGAPVAHTKKNDFTFLMFSLIQWFNGSIIQFRHSIHSDKDVFLRELVSNAADACDKRRFLSLTDGKAADQLTVRACVRGLSMHELEDPILLREGRVGGKERWERTKRRQATDEENYWIPLLDYLLHGSEAGENQISWLPKQQSL